MGRSSGLDNRSQFNILKLSMPLVHVRLSLYRNILDLSKIDSRWAVAVPNNSSSTLSFLQGVGLGPVLRSGSPPPPPLLSSPLPPPPRPPYPPPPLIVSVTGPSSFHHC